MSIPQGSSTMQPLGRILLVEDEPELRSILIESLTKQGFETAAYSSGTQALAELRKQDFDLLLTDLMMPEMDGIAVLKAALEFDPNLIGVVMTGQGTIQTAVDAMKLGGFDYVLKPFRMQTLMPVLTRAMNLRHLRLENVQLRETVAIYGLCQTIALTLDPKTVLSKLADAALQQSDADEVSILLPTEDRSELYVAAVRGEKRERLLGERIPFEQSIASWVARERAPVILNGKVNDSRFEALWPRPDITSSISMPMQAAGKLVGVINLNMTSRVRPFTLGQLKALTILAGTAAAALESASLYRQLQQAEEKYRAIFDNAIEGIFQSTIDGRFITANPAMARILGYDSPEEMIATVTDVAHQLYVDPKKRVEAARIQEERGVLLGFEFEAYRKDGVRIWLSANRRSVRNEKGEEIYREGSVEDITERKRAEQALTESDSRKEAILKSALDCVITVDHEGKIIDFNPAAEHTFGYRSENVVGRLMADLIIPVSYRPHHQAGFARYLATGRSAILGKRQEVTAVCEDGTEIPVELTITMIGDLPRPTFTAFIRDLTERKRWEAELRRSEERYRDLVENAHDLIYEHDLEGNYTSSNKAGERITGYSLEETLKMNLAQTVAPEYLETAQLMTRRKLAGEKVTAYDLEILAKDGSHIAVEVNTRLVFHDGVPVGVQGIARDVTERKQLEEQLRQSQKLEAVGQLAGGVAHDFNNLLTVIGGYSSMLLGKLPGESPHRSAVEEIKKAGDRAAGLTRQLLAFSRKQILQPVVLDLNVVVSDLDKMLRRLIGEDIDLLTLTEPGLGQVNADPGQMEQMVINLIVNARDAMPNGGKLTLQTSNVTLSGDYALRHGPVEAGDYVMVSVSDTGCGMEAEIQARIFEPFFTTKAAGKGTGLGLSTVYGIVKQSGGNIWVYSEVDQGTTFKIYLPRVDGSHNEPIAHASPAVLQGTETILLVEDEQQVRNIAEEILTSQGYKVLTAANGELALALANEYQGEIHLLITDVVMPVVSGRALVEQLSPLRPQMAVIYMSGYTDDAVVRHGLLGEQLEFIQKPFTADALARKVRSAFHSLPPA
ncbi:MAG: PAS domain S-box protein [Pyrinomonadaceae bacterium]